MKTFCISKFHLFHYSSVQKLPICAKWKALWKKKNPGREAKKTLSEINKVFSQAIKQKDAHLQQKLRKINYKNIRHFLSQDWKKLERLIIFKIGKDIEILSPTAWESVNCYNYLGEVIWQYLSKFKMGIARDSHYKNSSSRNNTLRT